ncbi:retinol dehydrogenase 8-like [Acipenser oxyrinchus oxyrinchus]|uniref:Retinol dehydrogenase 8-like n=1 Tax=Acipenser oxyrinchus oxyrinchus TaxID=40147 RepID=A0AAD8CZ04_ACIOX|nr:retinol dehydrogenase 8-like [Acipenser oxyrinchus oxyrinchus]
MMTRPTECQRTFFGVGRMIKEVYPDMKRRKSRHIVVTSSLMGLQAPAESEYGRAEPVPPPNEPEARGLPA